MKTLMLALAVVVSFGLNAHGQQNFSQTQLKQLNNRNSASAFTSQRVMSGVLFSKRLVEHGYQKHISNGVWYLCIRIKDQSEHS